jgi:hypothetical protein
MSLAHFGDVSFVPIFYSFAEIYKRQDESY